VLAFALFAAVLTITPGLDTLLVIRTAARDGRLAGLAAGFGIGLGCLAWAAASALGITALLAASTVGYQVLRWTGAAYLVFLGARALWQARRPPAPAAAPAAPEAPVGPGGPGGSGVAVVAARPGGGRVLAFRVGLVTNLLNPKIGVFYLSVLPQFIPPGAAPLPYSLVLALIHDVEGMVWFALLVLLVGRVSGWLGRPTVRRRLEQVTGVAFLGFGVRLAVE
jgi:threonine/homoserine/homoserine lactone efflux protein